MATNITFNVGGQHFTTTEQTIQASSYLSAITSNRFRESFKDGPIFIDRDPVGFAHILNYLRDPNHYIPAQYLYNLDFYGVDVKETEKEEASGGEIQKSSMSNPPISNYTAPGNLLCLCASAYQYSCGSISISPASNHSFPEGMVPFRVGQMIRLTDFLEESILWFSFYSNIPRIPGFPFCLLKKITLCIGETTCIVNSPLFLFARNETELSLNARRQVLNNGVAGIPLSFFSKEHPFTALAFSSLIHHTEPPVNAFIQFKPQLYQAYAISKPTLWNATRFIDTEKRRHIFEMRNRIPFPQYQHFKTILPLKTLSVPPLPIKPNFTNNISEFVFMLKVKEHEKWAFIPIKCVRIVICGHLWLDLPTVVIERQMAERGMCPSVPLYRWSLNGGNISMDRIDHAHLEIELFQPTTCITTFHLFAISTSQSFDNSEDKFTILNNPFDNVPPIILDSE